jgi:hypothetical protein
MLAGLRCSAGWKSEGISTPTSILRAESHTGVVVVLRRCGRDLAPFRRNATMEQMITIKLGIKTARQSLYLCQNQGLSSLLDCSITMLLQVIDKAPLGQARKFHAKISTTILGPRPCLKHYHLSFVKV